MSGWDNYVNLITSADCDSGAVLGHDGAVWASSAGFITPEEAAAIPAAFASVGSGIKVGGKKYFYVNQGLYRCAQQGIAIEKTNQTFLLGHHPEGGTLPQAKQVVEGVGEKLRQVNF